MILNTLIVSLIGDARHALRLAVRNPGSTLAALRTIALGVGGTAAVFSVVYGVLFRPLPYPAPDRIVSVAEEHPGATTTSGRVLFTNLTYAMWEPGARTIGLLLSGVVPFGQADAYGIGGMECVWGEDERLARVVRSSRAGTA
jgi:hypothetical protein